jgi:nucleotide-binding universal stress UspA family protein
VVFPTAVDVRGRRIDVYYGAADQRIAAATTQIASPVLLAPSAPPIAEERHHFVVPCQLAGKEFETEGRHEQEGDIAMKAEDTDNYCRILVALDGSPFAERVLPRVEPLAQKFGSTVTLIQAITPVQAPQMAELSSGVVSVEAPRGTWSITDEMRAHADSYLASVRKRLEARGLSVETECPEGEPSSVILHRACQLRADLIAITTHGRSGVDRMLFGSVAEDVLRRAPCPVLLVRVQDGH